MDLRAVEGVRLVGVTGVRLIASDVMPAAGVEGAGRMEEDSYGGNKKGQERGLDEDVDEVNEEEQTGEGSEISQEAGRKQVNLFA
jgi:hypothetical protein